MNDFENLVKNRQACRDFNDEEINLETLERILEVARLTPSACNSQPWHIYCVHTGDKVKSVCNALTEYGTRSLFLEKAKAFFVLCEIDAGYKPDVQATFGDNYFVKYDIGALASYLTLCAKSLGVDSCILGRVNKEILKDALNLPGSQKCNIVIALGHTDIKTREKIRKPLEEIVEFV